MNKLIENRISQLARIRFLKNDDELHAIMAVMNLFDKTDKYQGLGDQRMIDERIQKEQVSFINNMQEMFSDANKFLKFFLFHARVKAVKEARNKEIWRIVKLVESRDMKSVMASLEKEKPKNKTSHLTKRGSESRMYRKNQSKPITNVIIKKSTKTKGSE